ncbi:MAG TPA: crosslink repair DNA glycosylase YcaQ family protein, partial [Acidimicrobiales bacterium]
MVEDDGTDRLRRRRLRSQLLSGPPADSPEAVVGQLLAVQAQDGRGFRLAVRCRSRGLTTGDVDAALGDGRLVVTWLNRGTLHLVRSEDYWWLRQLTEPRVLPGVERRL